jgi:exonuclease VII small subunit
MAAVPQSPAPDWAKLNTDADIELRFELNYSLASTEPNQLLIASDRPDVAVFQLNLNCLHEEAARKILPDILFDYYGADRMTPLLTLSLLQYMFEHSGELPDDVNRVKIVAAPLRQFALTLLLSEELQVNREDFSSAMVGHERIRDLFKAQCRLLYPNYKTLMLGSKWQQDLQQYRYALERVTAEEGVSVARGRLSWEATKTGVADAFRIPKLSLTRLETLLNTLGDLIVKEEYSGRGSDSPVQLRFQLHPLEKQWLDQLDESDETASYKGMEVSALVAVDLLRQTGQQGYTMDEIQQVLLLLQSRDFVAFDQKRGLLLRKIEDIIELTEKVEEAINKLEDNVQKLDQAVPEFERGRFNIGELQAKLAAADSRDDLEILKNEVRRRNAGLMSFATSLAAQRRQKYSNGRKLMADFVQIGIPAWLSQPFSSSPLQDLLEQQRHQLAGAFETTLGEMRLLAVESGALLRDLPNSSVDEIILLQKETPKLLKKSNRLQTRLKSYDDQKEDLEAWRQVIRGMTAFETQTKQVGEKYGTDQWPQAAAALWQEQRDQIQANPLNIPSLHRDFAQKLIAEDQKLQKWLENRREDFEQQRQRYESALNQAGRDTHLRIPFDQQNPAESYSALFETVQQVLSSYLTDLQRRLNQVIQKIRYAEQVQGVDLVQAEKQAAAALQQAIRLSDLLSIERLRDMKKAQETLLDPLQETHKQEQALAKDVQHALQKRAPNDQERELLARLQELGTKGEIDLYSLIMRQIDQEDEAVDLDQLLTDLQALFQKNQIGIRIRLL